MTALIARLVMPLCGLCAALLGVMMLVGTATPPAPHRSIVTDSPCSLPCVYGILPGTSTREQASRTFDRSALSFTMLSETKPISIVRESNSARSMMIVIDFGSASSDTVRSVQLYQLSADHDLGFLSDLLLAGYTPQRVLMPCGSARRMILVLDEQGLFAQVALESRLMPHEAVLVLGVTGDATALAQLIHSLGCSVEMDWMGFASQWKYQAVS